MLPAIAGVLYFSEGFPYGLVTELFPTYLRSTGTSFCYNVGRFVAATGPALLGPLNGFFAAKFPGGESMRYAGVAMSGVFLLGLIVLPFAPETKDKPLPE